MPKIERPVIKEREFLSSIIILIIKLEVFFIPLFFLPFTFEIFEFSKQNLLWFFTFLASALWILKIVIVDKKIVYKRTPLDLPIVVLLAFWGASTIFSVDWFSSLFGYYGRFSDAYLSTLSFALLYFLIIHFVGKNQVHKIFNVIIASVAIVLVVSLASLSGLLMKIFSGAGTAFNFLNSNFFNPIGTSVESLALFSAVVLVLTTALYSYNIKGAKKMFVLNFKYYLLFVFSLLILLLVNMPAAWITAIMGLGAVFSFGLYIIYVNREDEDSAIEIAVAPSLSLFIVSVLFLFLFSGSNGINLYKTIFGSGLPRELTLPVEYNKQIVWESFKGNIIFGSGPGTFAYDFSAFRPAPFNNSQFWQLRFDKAGMHFFEILATTGLFGFLSYLAVIGSFLFVSFIFLKNMFRAKTEESYLAFAFTFAVLTLFISQALYLSNLTLNFLFWIFMALAMANWRFTYKKIFTDKVLDLNKHKDVRPIYLTFFILLLGLFCFLVILQFKYYLADTAYNSYRLTGDRKDLERATRLNFRRLNYHIALAKDYISEVRGEIEVLSNPGGNTEIKPEAKQKLQENIQKAIKEGEIAIEIAPNSVIVWETLGAIYRDVRFIAVGSLEPALRYFKKASELEPTNPVILTELGKLYLDNNQTKEALDYFEEAIKQKSNYYQAHVGLAKTYERLGHIDKALVALEETINHQPNAEVIYESGRLYYNQGNFDKAIERFTRATRMRPGYTNAIYSLGLAYQKKGDKIKALEQFEKVLEMNPGNEAVEKLVEEMQE